MMNKKFCLGMVALVLAISSIAIAAEAVSVEGVTCLLQGTKPANIEKHAKYKEGNVYFCCDGCSGKFAKMTDDEKKELSAKANSQLVATKQYAQEVCPFTGGKLNDETAIKVNGAEVKFCCNNCKGKAEKLEGDEQLEQVFGEKAFEKGKFKLVKKETK